MFISYNEGLNMTEIVIILCFISAIINVLTLMDMKD